MARLDEALEAVRRQLEQLNRPVLRYLQPGLLPVEFAEQTRNLDLDLPEAVRELYAWRNGTRLEPGVTLNNLSFFGAIFHFLSLEDAVRRRSNMVEHRSWEDDPRLGERWFPLFANSAGDYYFVDCTEPGPLARIVEHKLHGDEPQLVFESLERMMSTIAAWYEAGVYDLEEPGPIVADSLRVFEIARELNPGLPCWEDENYW
jgi:cell wall assembly regulator SMI1